MELVAYEDAECQCGLQLTSLGYCPRCSEQPYPLDYFVDQEAVQEGRWIFVWGTYGELGEEWIHIKHDGRGIHITRCLGEDGYRSWTKEPAGFWYFLDGKWQNKALYASKENPSDMDIYDLPDDVVYLHVTGEIGEPIEMWIRIALITENCGYGVRMTRNDASYGGTSHAWNEDNVGMWKKMSDGSWEPRKR